MPFWSCIGRQDAISQPGRKTPWRDGTTHVHFEPLALIARLAALIPRPGFNLTRYHGVFVPNSRWRAWITLARRGKRHSTDQHLTAPEKHRARPKAPRLKRVFRIDIETCEQCGGTVKIIACIENPEVIQTILDHLGVKQQRTDRRQPQAPRAPPLLKLSGLFD